MHVHMDGGGDELAHNQTKTTAFHSLTKLLYVYRERQVWKHDIQGVSKNTTFFYLEYVKDKIKISFWIQQRCNQWFDITIIIILEQKITNQTIFISQEWRIWLKWCDHKKRLTLNFDKYNKNPENRTYTFSLQKVVES